MYHHIVASWAREEGAVDGLRRARAMAVACRMARGLSGHALFRVGDPSSTFRVS